MIYNIFLDSGAPTLYNKLTRKTGSSKVVGSFLKNRKHDDYSWLNDEAYLNYRQRYVDYIKANEKQLTVYVNLDIVNNAEETWKNQLWFEKQGLKPLPVWHFGSDVSWLEHYIKKGYTYIGIGGLVPNPFSVIKPALDELFGKYFCDKKGMPIIKTHGFAATSTRLMVRYPWYSVDSATWIKEAAYGGIMIPQKVKGEYCYIAQPYKISISGRSPDLSKAHRHIKTVKPTLREQMIAYIDEMGFELGRSVFETTEDGKLKEIKIKEGLCNSPALRCFFNALYFIGLKKQMPEWPWPFRASRLSLF